MAVNPFLNRHSIFAVLSPRGEEPASSKGNRSSGNRRGDLSRSAALVPRRVGEIGTVAAYKCCARR
jgi:hypothetical protein